MIPREAYIALGAFLLLVMIAWGIKVALNAEYSKGYAAGSAIATAKCNDLIDEIKDAAELERKRLGKIALDLGIELARTDAKRRAIAVQLAERSDHEIIDHPSPAGCSWSDERVRIINDAAAGVGTSGTGESGSAMPGAVPGSPETSVGKP